MHNLSIACIPAILTGLVGWGVMYTKVDANSVELDKRAVNVVQGNTTALLVTRLTEDIRILREEDRIMYKQFLDKFDLYIEQQNDFIIELRLQRRDITYIQGDIGEIKDTLAEGYGD